MRIAGKNKGFALFVQVGVTIESRKSIVIGLRNYENSANICYWSIWNF
jgi:hypothetical protein